MTSDLGNRTAHQLTLWPRTYPSQATGGPSVPAHQVRPSVIRTCVSVCRQTDRQYDAWIPSEATQVVLESLAHSLPGTFYPSLESLTLPGCSLQNDLVRRGLGRSAYSGLTAVAVCWRFSSIV